VIAIDGTKVHASASHHSNLDYEQLSREILKEAGEIDAAEDELYGEARGDELPEHLRTREGRRAALAEAKRKLERDREQQASPKSAEADGAEAPEVKIGLPRRSSSHGSRAATDGCLRRAASSRSTAAGKQSRSHARAQSGCWRQSDGSSKTSRSSATPTRPMSTTARTDGTAKADGSVARRSHMSHPRYPREDQHDRS
jgi:hypothetical protein